MTNKKYTDEMLQALCDEFFKSIAERKKKACEIKDIRSCYKSEKYYVINSSRKCHHGWVFEFDSRTDTWTYFDCVICGSIICGSDRLYTYYWLNNFDRVKVNERNEISIRVDDYEYVSTKDDEPRKRDILLLLVAKLEELFKQ